MVEAAGVATVGRLLREGASWRVCPVGWARGGLGGGLGGSGAGLLLVVFKVDAAQLARRDAHPELGEVPVWPGVHGARARAAWGSEVW